jgi:hypothetical protein
MRVLNTTNNPLLLRKVGASITSTNTSVREIISAYTEEILTPKTAANCLRLMRLDVSNSRSVNELDGTQSTESLVWQLTRNIRIGIIKRGIRVCTLARKAERVMETTHQRVSGITKDIHEHVNRNVYTFKDNNSGVVHRAGSISRYADQKRVKRVEIFDLESAQDTTPELLMERSNRRIERRGLKFAD